MTTITLEGKEYQLDLEQAEKLGLLKEKDDKVRNWDEFKEKYRSEYGYFYEAHSNKILRTSSPISIGDQLIPHEAKAIAAFSKLLRLRRDWIGEWEPNWDTLDERKYVIERRRLSQFEILVCFTNSHVLSFPSYELAQEFLETFHELIEEAKILI